MRAIGTERDLLAEKVMGWRLLLQNGLAWQEQNQAGEWQNTGYWLEWPYYDDEGVEDVKEGDQLWQPDKDANQAVMVMEKLCKSPQMGVSVWMPYRGDKNWKVEFCNTNGLYKSEDGLFSRAVCVAAVKVVQGE